MTTVTLKATGINLWDDESEQQFYDPKEISKFDLESGDIIGVSASAVYAITTLNNKLSLMTSLRDEHKSFSIVLDHRIEKSCHNNEDLFLMMNDGVYKLDFFTMKLDKIHEKAGFVDISCTSDHRLYALDDQNQFHQLLPDSKLLQTFPRHQKIKKIVSGVEHTLLLTSNGDVFSCGCGLRGALGHSDVNSHETPKLIEALSGIKIVDVAAGSFHSVAVSSFGDLYSWGWNNSGQLGINSSTPKISLKEKVKNHQQVFTTPQLVDIEDELESIVSVHCGCKHTVARTENQRILVTGSNRMGQLGLSKEVEEIGKFTEAPIDNIRSDTKIFTGYWSTFLLSYNDNTNKS